MLRLCLVRVKAFPENIPFSRNVIFRKGKCFHVFGCISKKFPKNIFWCLEKKEKTNPEKYGQNPEWRSTLDWVWCTAPLREIAIDGAISRSVDCDLAFARSRRIDGAISWSVNRDRWWFFSWVCLFLLLFQTPENIFRKFFWNGTKHMKTFSFLKNSISGKWNIFRKCFYTNQTQPN